MIPFLSSGGGNSQDAATLVEVVAVTLKLEGDPVGTEENQCGDNLQQ